MKALKWLNIHKNVFTDSDLRFLIKNVLHYDSLGELVMKDISLDAAVLSELKTIKKFYLEGMPLAYILGKEEFFGLCFSIDRGVFIPRKETELVVEKTIEIINREESVSVLDLCCGCANIAVSIAKAISRPLHIYASDVSHEALRLAQQNLLSYKVAVRLVGGDLFSVFQTNSFDVIVTNPPYVETHNIKGSLCYEPKEALDGGRYGLRLIYKIINEAYLYLHDSGYLIMECGFKQQAAIDKLVVSCGHYTVQEWMKDYSGHTRAVVLKKKGKNG